MTDILPARTRRTVSIDIGGKKITIPGGTDGLVTKKQDDGRVGAVFQLSGVGSVDGVFTVDDLAIAGSDGVMPVSIP